jgi:hypothetical protein
MLFHRDSLQELCISGLLEQPDHRVRTEVFNGLSNICTSVALHRAEKRPTALLFPILVDCLPGILDRPGEHSVDFFNLLIRLCGHLKEQPFSGLESIYSRCVEMLSHRPILETRQAVQDQVRIRNSTRAQAKPVQVLRGLLRLLSTLIDADALLKNVVPSLVDDILLRRCLLDFPRASTCPQSRPPKCKTTESRDAAFALVKRLCSSPGGEANLSAAIDVLLPLHCKPNAHDDWQFRGRSSSHAFSARSDWR